MGVPETPTLGIGVVGSTALMMGVGMDMRCEGDEFNRGSCEQFTFLNIDRGDVAMSW